MQSKYTVELVNPATGKVLADLSGKADNRKVILSRNEPDEIEWRLDLHDFEHYATEIKVHPRSLIIPDYTEVRVKRLGKYLAAGQVNYANTVMDADTAYIEFRAKGFLDLFRKRRTLPEHEFEDEPADIAWALIEYSQGLPNGDFGIEQGPNQAVVGVRKKIYKRSRIKDALQNFTTVVEVAPIDIEFTWDKKFNTYAQIGSLRRDIAFAWPGNIKRLEAPDDATELANEVTALGAGFGEDAGVSVTVEDEDSQMDHYLRQEVIMSNGTDNSDGGVTNAANTHLVAWRRPYDLPRITLDGNKAPYVTDYSIGDWIKLKVDDHPWLEHLNAYHRLERLELMLDKDDNEVVVPELSR